ncbi:[FeFe] hydrogenase H-cluster radical SAM maturase HydE [uncultured Parvimonas sp.]|uniref:[FeFe] hydrogenase H-cluster radical SAM maturase HydE n=1 Tax=uncultured Parvimonas sp. TaxID=747372 RepID=UPI00259427F2|nr:[FeFe] hydrogenase H-cluster radical SAM maturase HydE [uncultured Parvimonas sp.]
MQKIGRIFSDDELKFLLTTDDESVIQNLHKDARAITNKIYGNKIYIRGLVEFSNYCSQCCYYCGINSSNSSVKRFRLTEEEILQCAKLGYERGFRTFVLQGGEDPKFTDQVFISIISKLKENYPDCAITLSIGVREKNSYQKLKDAGADRFLLRFETARKDVFEKLHHKNQSLEKRIRALKDLREVGFVTGTGFMVGAPYSSVESHIEDIKLIRELKTEMIGVGPFVPHNATKFKDEVMGNLKMSLIILSILRLENPYALIPSTTALNTIDSNGRILGILSGANVLMPNLSPNFAKENYSLYNDKQKNGLESFDGLVGLKKLLKDYGFEIEITRGDYKGYGKN